jgi:predicted phage tail protein
MQYGNDHRCKGWQPEAAHACGTTRFGAVHGALPHTGPGEGEFAGGLDATRIFLDGTPLGNADGTMNFENVSWDFRPGTDPDADPGLSCGRKRNQVGVSLTKATPWIRALSNTQIDAVLVRVGIPGLQLQENDGDIVGTSVTYHIDLRWMVVLTLRS